MSRRLLMLVVLVAASVAAHAQPMLPGKWWQRPEIVQELQITQEQQTRLDAVFRNAADELIDTKASIEKLQLAVRGELDRAQIRRAELQKLVAQLNTARGRLFELELMMLVDMRGVLNETQWVKIRNHLDRIERDRRPGQGPPRGRRP